MDLAAVEKPTKENHDSVESLVYLRSIEKRDEKAIFFGEENVEEEVVPF